MPDYIKYSTKESAFQDAVLRTSAEMHRPFLNFYMTAAYTQGGQLEGHGEVWTDTPWLFTTDGFRLHAQTFSHTRNKEMGPLESASWIRGPGGTLLRVRVPNSALGWTPETPFEVVRDVLAKIAAKEYKEYSIAESGVPTNLPIRKMDTSLTAIFRRFDDPHSPDRSVLRFMGINAPLLSLNDRGDWLEGNRIPAGFHVFTALYIVQALRFCAPRAFVREETEDGKQRPILIGNPETQFALIMPQIRRDHTTRNIFSS